MYAPTIAKENGITDDFYDNLPETHKRLSANIIKIIIGNLNMKCEKRTNFVC